LADLLHYIYSVYVFLVFDTTVNAMSVRITCIKLHLYMIKMTLLTFRPV